MWEMERYDCCQRPTQMIAIELKELIYKLMMWSGDNGYGAVVIHYLKPDIATRTITGKLDPFTDFMKCL